ncbi:hypothetical protein RFM98_29680 [Mesorhizobium sp. VK9D]|nr:hypothetical protein [Mesorhizobium sp. VK9D]MDX8456911.1 hypothetical protein [Mesorhizobium sp. VK9D]
MLDMTMLGRISDIALTREIAITSSPIGRPKHSRMRHRMTNVAITS